MNCDLRGLFIRKVIYSAALQNVTAKAESDTCSKIERNQQKTNPLKTEKTLRVPVQLFLSFSKDKHFQITSVLVELH